MFFFSPHWHSFCCIANGEIHLRSCRLCSIVTVGRHLQFSEGIVLLSHFPGRSGLWFSRIAFAHARQFNYILATHT